MRRDMQATVLQALGLNALESEVYTHLLVAAEPVTAYRLGKALGKPTANVYKAIEALVRKGAVVTDESEPKLCRPVGADEFLAQLERGFAGRVAAARTSLAKLGEPPPDQRVYDLQSVPLVVERAHSMLRRAERVAVIEVFPAVAQELRDVLQETIDRGVDVYVQLYAPLELSGGHVVDTHEGETSREHWRSEQLNLVVDGREVLLALLWPGLEEVFQALATSSLYLACLIHAGMMREHFFSQVGELARGLSSDDPLRRLIDEHPVFHSMDVPGQRELFQHLRMEA